MVSEREGICHAFHTLEPMKNRLFHGLPVLQVVNHNSLEQFGSNVSVPYPFGIHDDNWTHAAYSKAGSLTSLYTIGTEQQVLALQQLRESRIQFATATIG